jgi:putative cell wall-binding protein
MAVQTVYIMGGTSAVSAETEQAIKNLKIATVRVAGADRQATSVEAFKLIDGNWYKHHGTHSVIIATGANFADALSIAPFAYRTGTPVVLTKADGTLTDEAVKAIKDNDEIYQVIVVGGTSVVSDSVFSVLGTYSGNYKDYYNKVYVPVRIAGADRYDTSAKIADWEVNYAFDVADDYNKNDYWKDAGFSYYETFVATGENFPDALAGGQLAGGKFYANSTATVATRWGGKDYRLPTIKAASPILLTKDGNRAADSVIASNLAWNWNTVSVDAYEFCNATLVDYLDDFLSLDQISGSVYANGAHGFFTAAAPVAGTMITTVPVGWIDGYRVVDNNFNGVILGGKAAVSKDKAKQLDDTVKDSIRKINDPVANTNSSSITINGKTYRTLSWLNDTATSWFSNLGVNGFGNATTGDPWKDTFKASEVIAVPYGNYGLYQYLYQPYDVTNYAATYDPNTGAILTQSYTINFAVYDSTAVNGFMPTNGYTGYGFSCLMDLDVTFNYNTGTVVGTWS